MGEANDMEDVPMRLISEPAFEQMWRPTSQAASKDPVESARVGKAIRAMPPMSCFRAMPMC